MALLYTLLQVITFVIGYLVAFGIFRRRSGLTWATLAYVAAVVVAWPVGVIVWGVAFVSGSYTDAIVNGMPRSLLFALLGPGLALYLVRKRRPHNDA